MNCLRARWLFFATSAWLLLQDARGATILVTTYPGALSHSYFHLKVGRELVARGHEVLFYHAKLDGPNLNFSNGIEPLGYGNITQEWHDEQLRLVSQLDPFRGTVKLVDAVMAYCEGALQDKALQERLTRTTIDLIWIDATNVCNEIIAERYSIRKKVLTSPISFYDPFFSEKFQIPVPLAYIPVAGTGMTEKMGLLERTINLCCYLVMHGVAQYMASWESHLRSKYPPLDHTPPETNEGLLLMPSFWGFEWPRAIGPNIQMIGPILPDEPSPLPVYLDSWVKERAHILLVSLGTATIPALEQILEMKTAFGALNVSVLWALRKTASYGLEQSQMPSNVRLESFVPQNDLLGHPHVKLFLTHGGMNGVQEALFHGKPMIVLPFLGDQWDNGAKVATRGAGIVLDRSVSAHRLQEAIKAVLSNESFTRAAQHLGVLSRTYGRVGAAVDWVEHVLVQGYNERLPHGFHLQWWQKSLLDVYLLLAIIFLLPAGCCFSLCCLRAKRMHVKQD